MLADRIYSLTLALSMGAAAVAFVLALFPRPGAARGARAAACAGLVLALASTAVHVGFGHRPGTETALGAGAFVAEHPANFVMTAVAAALLAWRPRRLRQRS